MRFPGWASSTWICRRRRNAFGARSAPPAMDRGGPGAESLRQVSFSFWACLSLFRSPLLHARRFAPPPAPARSGRTSSSRSDARRCQEPRRNAPMDMARSEVRKLAAEDYSTAQHLEHASRQARERNYQDFLIVDVDAHHYENESYNEVFTYIESPVIRRQAVESAKRGARASMLGGTIGYQDIGQ